MGTTHCGFVITKFALRKKFKLLNPPTTRSGFLFKKKTTRYEILQLPNPPATCSGIFVGLFI